MQTPLAICRNRLEMLMEDDSLSEAQLEELIKTHQTLEHITKLNKSLLLLSKIDNGQFSETQTVEFNSMLKRYIEDYEEVYGYREIELTLDEQGTFRAEMNESLAVALITNLLKNAFVHNVDGGHIRIEITDHSMTFRNSGTNRPLDATHIFERFYQEAKGRFDRTGTCHSQTPSANYSISHSGIILRKMNTVSNYGRTISPQITQINTERI